MTAEIGRPSGFRFVAIGSDDLPRFRGVGLGGALDGAVGLMINDFWTTTEAEEWALRVDGARDAWRTFDDVFGYSALGNPLFAFRAADALDEYFLSAEASDATVSRLFPGLEARLLAPFRTIEDPRRCVKRPGHAGPGFMIQRTSSRHYAHYDLNEGLAAIRSLWPATDRLYTAVGMLKRPSSGGRLFVWNRVFDAGQPYGEQIAPRTSDAFVAIEYPVGALLLLNGMFLHRIEETVGERVTVNFHVMRTPQDELVYWF